MLDIIREFGILTIVRALWAPSLLAGAIFTLVGLVSVWAALSRRHWFIRAVVVAAVLSATLAIRGHDAVLVFLLQSLMAVACISALKIRRTRPPRANASKNAEHDPASGSTTLRVSEKAKPSYPQFSLLDLMLMVLVVAAICAIVAQTPPRLLVEWPGITITGLSFGGLTFWLRQEFAAIIFRRNRPKWLARKPLRGKLHLAFRLFVSAILPLGVILLLFPGAYLYHRVINPLPRPTVAMPVPNGYEDLVRAGEMLNNVRVPDSETARPEAIQAFVRNNIQVFDTVRRGLNRECRVRLTYNHTDLARCVGFRQLMRALIAEGKLAEADGRPGDAVTSYLDGIRLAEAISHGGLLVNRLVGRAIERTGVEELLKIPDPLDHLETQRAIDSLQALDTRRESIDAVFALDRIWTDHVYGKLDRVWEVINRSSPQGAASFEMIRSTLTSNRTRTRLAICKLAIRRYQLDHDRLPDSLADLVPEYLGSVPEDPFGGQPIVYRPDPAGPILYSVGPDGRDDGGKPLDWSSRVPVPPGDVLLIEPEDVVDEPVEAE
jgi:hypothetical protein